MTKRKLNKEFHIRDIYHNQLKTSSKRGYPPPAYYVDDLKQWCLSQSLYHALHAAWVASGFVRMLAPSVDRLDDYLPYSLTNIQLMTAGDNLQKSFIDTFNGVLTKRSTGVIQKSLDGTELAKFPSMNLAGRAVGAANGSRISAVCKGKRASAHGYLWSLQ